MEIAASLNNRMGNVFPSRFVGPPLDEVDVREGLTLKNIGRAVQLRKQRGVIGQMGVLTSQIAASKLRRAEEEFDTRKFLGQLRKDIYGVMADRQERILHKKIGVHVPEIVKPAVTGEVNVGEGFTLANLKRARQLRKERGLFGQMGIMGRQVLASKFRGSEEEIDTNKLFGKLRRDIYGVLAGKIEKQLENKVPKFGASPPPPPPPLSSIPLTSLPPQPSRAAPPFPAERESIPSVPPPPPHGPSSVDRIQDTIEKIESKNEKITDKFMSEIRDTRTDRTSNVLDSVLKESKHQTSLMKEAGKEGVEKELRIQTTIMERAFPHTEDKAAREKEKELTDERNFGAIEEAIITSSEDSTQDILEKLDEVGESISKAVGSGGYGGGSMLDDFYPDGGRDRRKRRKGKRRGRRLGRSRKPGLLRRAGRRLGGGRAGKFLSRIGGGRMGRAVGAASRGAGKLLGIGAGIAGIGAPALLESMPMAATTATRLAPTATKAGGVAAKTGGVLSKTAGLGGKALGKAGRLAGKLAIPLTVGMGMYDAYKGFTGAGEKYGDKEGKVDLGTKMASGASSVLKGLTLGLVDLGKLTGADQAAAESKEAEEKQEAIREASKTKFRRMMTAGAFEMMGGEENFEPTRIMKLRKTGEIQFVDGKWRTRKDIEETDEATGGSGYIPPIPESEKLRGKSVKPIPATVSPMPVETSPKGVDNVKEIIKAEKIITDRTIKEGPERVVPEVKITQLPPPREKREVKGVSRETSLLDTSIEMMRSVLS
jgi:hypothetical protein